MRLFGESTALRVGESEAFEAESLAQHPVLREQVVDLESLRALEPSGDDQDEELERGRDGGGAGIGRPALLQRVRACGNLDSIC